MFKWLLGRGASARRVTQEAARISPELWNRTLAAHPYLRGLSTADLEDLRYRTAWVLASKTFSSTHGLVLTDDILLSIAVQAALPILRLSPTLYEGWTEIIVYPGGFLIPRQEVSEDGVVHEYLQEAAGEAWDGGPVIVSWEDARVGGTEGNVVIHEFAHKLDLTNGVADGMPMLVGHPYLRNNQWHDVLQATFDAFTQRLEHLEASIPPHIDPESSDADPWYEHLPLDPYAATDVAEFFAVSSEALFVDPYPLAAAYPAWYELLAAYYGQDPRERLAETPVSPLPLKRL